MNEENFNKICKELKDEILENDKQLNVSDERKRMAYVNQFEYKLMETISFSLLPYLGLAILSAILIKNEIISSLVKFVPAESIPIAFISTSLCIGTIGRKVLEWKFKTKERLKVFTTANTQSEKIQEEVKYAIEFEKAKNKKKANLQTIDLLNSNPVISNTLSSECDINIAQIKEKSKKEDLSVLLEDNCRELDVLTTQKVLHEKFWRVRENYQKAVDIIMTGMFGGLFTICYGTMPFLIVRSYAQSLSLVSFLMSFITGIACGSLYMLKRNRDYMMAFNNLNNVLGENALPDKIKEPYEEGLDIDAKIASKIREVSITKFILQEQKTMAESYVIDSSEDEEVRQSSISKEYIVESQKKDENIQDDLTTFIEDDIALEIEEEQIQEEKGPTLVLRKK